MDFSIDLLLLALAPLFVGCVAAEAWYWAKRGRHDIYSWRDTLCNAGLALLHQGADKLAWLLVIPLYQYEGAVNSAAQIHGLELVYTIGPIVFVMLGGACFLGYKLTAERHAEIRRQLEERDAAYDEAAVLEGLTGEPGAVAP